MKLTVMIICIAGMILSSSVFAATIRVPADQPTIQAGIDAAVNGDTVLVADGTYTGDGNRDIDFKGKAITVTSENGAETCIIDCQYEENHRGFHFDSNETEDTIVQGFTVQNGYSENGGGILCVSSFPTIKNCAFTNNYATNTGGGIHLKNCSYSAISKCTFTLNTANTGGGIYIGVSPNSTISNCTFIANSAITGGGIYLDESEGSTISNCTCAKNIAWDGGGTYFYASEGSTISNCTFTENTANYDGGGIRSTSSSLTISNCIFSENKANQIRGGGICFWSSSDSTISNCIFTNNSAGFGGGIYCGDSLLTISNCILWNNNPDEIEVYISDLTSICSLIQGGYPGIGNIDTDPFFLGGDPFDYHLAPNSPCIDAGTDNGAPATDFHDNPRPQGGAVDMGAFEYSGWPSETRAYIEMPYHHFQPGDKASCSGSVWNPHEYVFDEYLFFAVLDIWGTFYCAPSYSMIDYYFQDCNPGLTEIQIMPEFTWPDGVGSASGIVWYAALVNPEMTELVSEIGVFDFGWSD